MLERNNMRAICTKCGERATVTLTLKGFYYHPGALLRCPVIKERMKKNGGTSSDMHCDHMALAAEAVADRIRGHR